MFRRGRIALFAALALACSRPGEREIQRGNQAALKGQNEAALAAYEAATTQAPDNARGWAFKGVALRRLGRTQEADAAWRTALVLEAGQPTASLGLARLSLDSRDAGAALETLSGLGDPARDAPAARLLRAMALLARGGPGDAALALEEAAAVAGASKDSADAAYLHGSALVALGRYSEAQSDFEALERLAPTSPLGPYGLARLAAAQGRSTDALLYLRAARGLSGEAWAPARVEADPAFAFLTQMPEFRALLEP